MRRWLSCVLLTRTVSQGTTSCKQPVQYKNNA